jgi:hypothetical protein
VKVAITIETDRELGPLVKFDPALSMETAKAMDPHIDGLVEVMEALDAAS